MTKACQGLIAIAIGQRIKELRIIRGWTQRELAVKVGSYKEIVNRLEHGGKGSCPSIKTILKYTKAFQVDPELIIEVIEEQRILSYLGTNQHRISVFRNRSA